MIHRIIVFVVLVIIILNLVFGVNIIDTTKLGFDHCGSFICGDPKMEVYKLKDLVDTKNEGSVLVSHNILLNRSYSENVVSIIKVRLVMFLLDPLLHSEKKLHYRVGENMIYRIIVFIVLVLLVLNLVFAANVIDTTKLGFDHCGSFICGDPKMEVYKLKDLVDNKNEGSVLVSHNILLNRCRKTTGGCCPNTQLCTASKKEQICIKFKFQYISFDAPVEKYIVVENHLNCSCQTKENYVQEGGFTMKDKCEV
ncbi:unnamed protein product [Ceutorhynchus assimilis]|uniref:Uncharacterized protein n=1 Tax=Ceutorhynchus assimilis TaxID=467358 RepID=A0A9N9QP46_9CUCU|nr:unnamed protein product [Ceutorhynchus assimilis]